MFTQRLLVLSMIMALALSACAGAATTVPSDVPEAPPAAGGVKELNILWALWFPADYLQELANQYEAESGVKVTVIQVDWTEFYDRFSTDMAAKEDTWDMVIGDSQWLGQAVTSGWFVDLTDFLTSTGLKNSVTPAALTYYGEYPRSSGKYWAFPAEGDGIAWAYRKDLFENPDQQAAFKEKYGYKLAAPETYQQLKDIAEFFTRPDQNLFGLAIFTERSMDGLTMGVQSAMFPWGGDWHEPATNQVMGIVNSQQNVDAVQFYGELQTCCQWPGGNDVAYFYETNAAISSGQAVMAMNFFAFFPDLLNQEANPNYYDKIGFFPNPKGPTGLQGATMGGQAISVNAFVSPERQEAARAFLQWFGREDIQARWGELGGGTCNANVLKTEKFLNATPYNPAFAATMTFVKDFWNIPDYDPLLRVAAQEFGKFILDGVGTAQETMDTIAAEHEKILEENGYIK